MLTAKFPFLKSSCLWIPIIGGILFVAIFYARYLSIPEYQYAIRDDGVITLSHAKNLIDYGFIGVNPSGERVEGYSAPLQFFIYAVLYALTGLSFSSYINLQTLVCTFALGACFISFFDGKYSYRIAATILGATLLAAQNSFLEWHGSGMENPITHVSFLGTMLVLYSAIRNGKINRWLAVIPFLASISRLESVYYIAPLLALFCLYWHNMYKTPEALRFSGIALGGWAMFMAWRYMYFGTIIPNTTVAQGIDIMWRIRNPLSSLNDTIYSSSEILTYHGIYVIPLLVPMLYFLTARPRKPTVFLMLMFLTALVLAFFHTFFFGHARMDLPRTTTHFAICIALAASMLIFHSQKLFPIFAAFPLLLTIWWAGLQTESMITYKIGWGVDQFRGYFADITSTAIRENIPRATIANADLGMISWQKEFNIVDLGKIGSPILATLSLKREGSKRIPDYFYDFAAPDIIESHSNRACIYYDLYHDPRFRERYKPVREKSDPTDCDGRETLGGMWIRKDMLAGSGSAERQLVDNLLNDLSIRRIEDELTKCELSVAASGHGNCAYVARAAYRFLPEFRQQGTASELSATFDRSKTIRKFGYYLMNGADNATAYKGAIEEIMRYNP